MSRLIDVAATLESMAATLSGTEQGAACEFAVKLMREREADGFAQRERDCGRKARVWRVHVEREIVDDS